MPHPMCRWSISWRTWETVTVEEVNEAFYCGLRNEPLKGILQAVKEQLVSSDFNGTHWSSSVDLLSTMVVDGSMVKVLGWYDNETGFSRRMLDLAAWMDH